MARTTISGTESRKRKPGNIHALAISASPFSQYVEHPEPDGALFRFMIPARGQISNITFFIEKMNVKGIEIELIKSNSAGSETKHVRVVQGLMESDAIFDVSRGDRIYIGVIMPDKTPEILSIWCAFCFKHKVAKVDIVMEDRK